LKLELLQYIQKLLDENKLVFEDSLDEVSFDMEETEIAKLVKLHDENIDLTDETKISSALQEIMEGIVHIASDFAKQELEKKNA
jgi:GTPase involved in cell partitioning and DNA repair